MCGRFTLHHVTEEVVERFGVNQVFFPLTARYNIAPSQRIAVITEGRVTGARYLEGYKWGLVPFWSRDPDIGHRLINARAETLAKKPAFKYALTRRRCIIPASGFFEWKKGGDERFPLHIRPRGGEFFGFAGLWEEWMTPQGWAIRTCTLITTETNRLLAPLHDRMPAILRPQDEAAWLDPSNQNGLELLRLLQPYPVEKMEVYPVSQRVNLPAFDDVECIEPVEDARHLLPQILHSTEATKLHRLPPKRRQVLRDFAVPGQVFFKTRSFTRDDYTYWHPVVDLETGHVFSDCPDFRFRHAEYEPDVMTPQHWCKHLARAVKNCERHGELQLHAGV